MTICRSLARLGAVLLTVAGASCATDQDPESETQRAKESAHGRMVAAASALLVPTSGEQCFDDPAGLYRHRAQNAPLSAGGYHAIDIHTSPSGGTYALAREVVSLEEGVELITHSGVIELPTRLVSDEEQQRRAQDKVEHRQQQPVEESKVGPLLEERLAAGDLDVPGGAIEVIVDFQYDDGETVQKQVQRAIAAGAIKTYEDYELISRSFSLAKADAMAAVRASGLLAVGNSGATGIRPCAGSTCVIAGVTNESLQTILTLPEVRSVELLETEETLTADHDGAFINEIFQSKQFWDYSVGGNSQINYDGENGGTTDITAAIIDLEGYRRTHLGFRENNDPNDGNRIRGMFDCDDDSCDDPVADFDSYGHGHWCAGAMLGDFTDGQNSALSSGDRPLYSSPAREARAWLYRKAGGVNSFVAAMTHITTDSDVTVKPSLVSISFNLGTDCNGTSTASKKANELLYQQGIAVFAAMGNNGGSAMLCKAGSPASGIGVFGVGGYDDGVFDPDPLSIDPCEVLTGSSVFESTNCEAKNTDVMHTCSGWGGGRGRSIVGAASFFGRKKNMDSGSDTASSTFSGTSHATPLAAGLAADFIDMYRDTHDTWINAPGPLYTWMTLFGDRQSPTGKLPSGFHEHYGAGRLRMRMLNTQGLDTPYLWGDGEYCIADDQEQVINLNGGSNVPLDTDSLKAVIWWYDRNHGLNASYTIPDIDLYVEDASTGLPIEESTRMSENREMVYVSDITPTAARPIRLRIHAFSVPSGAQEDCSAGQVKVYYAYLAEDNDRDDSDGPSYTPSTCTGVAPL